MTLFEYAIIVQPVYDDGKIVEKGEIIAVDNILAEDEDEVRMRAARRIPEEHMEHVERVEVLVRPFC